MNPEHLHVNSLRLGRVCFYTAAKGHVGNVQDYTVTPLDVGARTGGDRLLLWLPMTISHTIDENSPLASWMDSTDTAVQDDDSTIVVMVR